MPMPSLASWTSGEQCSGIGLAVARKARATPSDEVTVVDPACGSGAYLLGMMLELVERARPACPRGEAQG